jgi:hypothetical protein
VFVPDKPLQARLWVRPEPPSGLALALNIRKALKGLPGNNHYRFFTRNEEEVFERAEHLNAGFQIGYFFFRLFPHLLMTS